MGLNWILARNRKRSQVVARVSPPAPSKSNQLTLIAHENQVRARVGTPALQSLELNPCAERHSANGPQITPVWAGASTPAQWRRGGTSSR